MPTGTRKQYRGFYNGRLPVRWTSWSGAQKWTPAGIGVHGGSQGGALSSYWHFCTQGRWPATPLALPFLSWHLGRDRADALALLTKRDKRIRSGSSPDLGPQVETTVAYYGGAQLCQHDQVPNPRPSDSPTTSARPKPGYSLHESLAEYPEELLMMEGCAHDAGAYFFGENDHRFLAEHLHPVSVD